ncbi:MAG: exodeoxyribonuclease VII large subunit [Motiliproteus sp.]
MTPTRSDILSVSDLNQQTRQLLEQNFSIIQVTGEISNFACPSSGHWYFTLKDDRAQVRCALFKTRSRFLRYRPKNGDQVLLRAKVSLYEGRGEYQLIGEYLEAAGSGDLQAAFDLLKQKLQTEGLFAAERKRSLPRFPRHIGVITSPTGAAIQDILSVLKRRFPAIPVTLYPAAVQGDEAPQQLCEALDLANRSQLCDLLIIGRGGGSAEDLAAFNNESLARAVFNSPIPIISAVGHETDVSICDFVADAQAPTPSAAAELISPDREQLAAQLQHHQSRMLQLFQHNLRLCQHRMDALRSRLRHPGQRLQEQAQRLDSLELRLRHANTALLVRQQSRLAQLQRRLQAQLPNKHISRLQRQLPQLQQRLTQALNYQLRLLKQRLAEQAHALNAISPLATLDRGYALVTTSDQQLLLSSHQVSLGETLHSRLAQGSVWSQVTAIEPPPPSLLSIKKADT